MIGWLQFFFEGYLPESPCPPGCRSLHHHTNYTPPKYKNGSINSSSSSSSLGHGSDEYYKSGFGGSAGDASDSYGPFAPIPLKIDSQRKLSVPFSDGKASGSITSLISSPIGYPEDNYHYSHNLTPSEEDLREIDDLISLYSEKCSESESDSINISSPNHLCPSRSPHRSLSESEAIAHRPSQVAECVLAKCHCMGPRLLSVEDVLSKSPLQSLRKKSKDMSTQCVFSDIVPEAPSPKLIRNMSPTDDDTLTKHPRKKRLSETMAEYNDQVMKKADPRPSPLALKKLKINRTPSPPHDHNGLFVMNSAECTPVTERANPVIICDVDPSVSPDLTDISPVDVIRSPTGLQRDLCQTSSGATTLSSSLSYQSSEDKTWASHNYEIQEELAPHISAALAPPHQDLTASTSSGADSLLSNTHSSDNSNAAKSDCFDEEDEEEEVPKRNSKFVDLEANLTELSFFPPFVIDFFQFAAHPEDYLTDSQLDWYFEGEAKLMKRREERKRARNALIEETTRLEASNAASSGVPGERRLISVNREINASPKVPKDVRQLLPDVETVDIPENLLENPTVIRLALQLKNSENLRNEVLVNCAKLENDRSALLYKVEDLKDQLEDQTELCAETKISLKAKCRDIEKLKMSLSQASKDVELLKCQVEQREALLKERAGIVITQLGDIMEVPLDSASSNVKNDGTDSKYSIIKVEDIENENNALKEEINNLKEDMHTRNKYSDASRNNSIDDQDLVDKRRELEKAVSMYKTRLTIEEQDKIKLQGQISVLESQVKRYKGQVENLSATEDEAQLEKRRIQREMRSVQDELQTSKDDYSILVKKMEKMQKLNQHR